MFYFARCMNMIFNSLLAQLVTYDVHTTCKIKSIHTLYYHILLFYEKGHISCSFAEDLNKSVAVHLLSFHYLHWCNLSTIRNMSNGGFSDNWSVSIEFIGL